MSNYFTLFLVLQLTISICSGQISTWQSKGVGGGGALFSPSFSPHNVNEVYMSCDMSELFHSTDLGNTWDLTDYRKISAGTNSEIQFTNSASILYCINYVGDIPTPVKSIDGGVTWNTITDPTGGEAYTLLADVNNSNNILISSYNDIYYSSNSGSSFSLKYSALGGNGLRVAGAFFDGSSIYVGTNEGLLVSANGGTTFTLSGATGIPAGEVILSFAGAKQSATRFFCIAAPSADVYPGMAPSDYYDLMTGVYSMDVGITNWVSKMSGITLGTDFPFFVAMAKNNISVAYLGGGSDPGDPIVLKTSNGGTAWQHVFQVTNNQNITTGWSGYQGDRTWGYGECAMGFTVAPFDATKIAITDFGFIHISSNGGTSWNQKYVSNSTENPAATATPKNQPYESNGLENTTCWQVTWADASNMIASFSDIRGVRSTDAGTSWSFNYTGHAENSMYRCIKHPVSSILYAATSTVHDIYQSTRLTDATLDGGDGRIIYSSTNGATWSLLHDFNHPVSWLASDPTNANRLYASVIHSTLGGIYVSSDIQNGAASNWTKVSNPPRTEGHPFNIIVLNDGTLVCSYSGRRTTVFTASSGIFVSTDNGANWIDRSDNGMLYWTKDIVVDPYDLTQNTWYVGVFSGWGGAPNGLGGLYKTTDRGINWTRINDLDRVTSCTISPVNADEMYLTTEGEGLWYSDDLTNSTPTFSNVTSYLFRQPERVFYNPYNTNEVWVTSFGNGMKMGLNTSTGIFNKSSSENENFASVFPNPIEGGKQLSLFFELKKEEDVTVKITDAVQKEYYVQQYKIKTNSDKIKIKLPEIPSGMYFVEITTSDKVQIVKLVVK